MASRGWGIFVVALGQAVLVACASAPAVTVATPPVSPAGTAAATPAVPPAQRVAAQRLQPVATAPVHEPAPPAERPKLCGVSSDESELAALVSAQVGLGLLWLADGAGESRAPDGSVTARSQRSFQQAARAVRQSLALAKCMLQHRDGGFTATLRHGQVAIEAWLDAHLSDPADAPVLLSAGTAYFASLLAATSPVDAMLDVPIALTLLERAVRFDPGAQDGLGLMLLGAYDCYLPAPVGGQPQRGSTRLQQVAAGGGALSRVAQVVDAELCMVGLQDRVRFAALLTEVIEAGGEQGNTGLSPFDGMARGRAAFLMSEADEFFLE